MCYDHKVDRSYLETVLFQMEGVDGCLYRFLSYKGVGNILQKYLLFLVGYRISCLIQGGSIFVFYVYFK